MVQILLIFFFLNNQGKEYTWQVFSIFYPNEKENERPIKNTSKHKVRSGLSNSKSTVLKRLYHIMGFTKGSSRQKTCNDSMDNFTVRESNKHNCNREASLNCNSNTQQQNKYQRVSKQSQKPSLHPKIIHHKSKETKFKVYTKQQDNKDNNFFL